MLRATSRWTDDQIATLWRLVGQGTKDDEIAAALGRSATAVRLKRLHGLPVNPDATVNNRSCMTCRHPFRSEGPHNRMCTSCRHLTPNPFER